MNDRSRLLFADPSFISGAASVFDLGDTLTDYNSSESPAQADYNALRSDWRAVGDDMRAALAELRREVERARE